MSRRRRNKYQSAGYLLADWTVIKWWLILSVGLFIFFAILGY